MHVRSFLILAASTLSLTNATAPSSNGTGFLNRAFTSITSLIPGLSTPGNDHITVNVDHPSNARILSVTTTTKFAVDGSASPVRLRDRSQRTRKFTKDDLPELKRYLIMCKVRGGPLRRFGEDVPAGRMPDAEANLEVQRLVAEAEARMLGYSYERLNRLVFDQRVWGNSSSPSSGAGFPKPPINGDVDEWFSKLNEMDTEAAQPEEIEDLQSRLRKLASDPPVPFDGEEEDEELLDRLRKLASDPPVPLDGEQNDEELLDRLRILKSDCPVHFDGPEQNDEVEGLLKDTELMTDDVQVVPDGSRDQEVIEVAADKSLTDGKVQVLQKLAAKFPTKKVKVIYTEFLSDLELRPVIKTRFPKGEKLRAKSKFTRSVQKVKYVPQKEATSDEVRVTDKKRKVSDNAEESKKKRVKA